MQELRVMSVMAHQDDFEFEIAGLFHRLKQHYGEKLRLKILTTSRGGSGHHIHDVETTAAIRDQEARNSAARVGAEYENLVQLDGTHVQAQVFCDRNMLGGLWNAVRNFAPHYLIAPPVASNPLAGVHIDHQHTAEAVRLIAYQLGVPNAYPTMTGERILRYKPPVIFNCIDAYAKEAVWHFKVDIDDLKQEKIAMLQCHKSQLEEWLPFVNNLDKENVPQWTPEEYWLQTHRRHVTRNTLCGSDSERWYEYLAISAWGSGSWQDQKTREQIQKDFPFIEWNSCTE